VTPPQLSALKKQLQKLEADLVAKQPRKVEPNRTDDAKVGGDEDEQPLNEMEQVIASNRNRNDQRQLALIRTALQRLASSPDTFGECADCEEPIAPARLKAMPWATLCIECQGKRDLAKTGGRRKNLTDFAE
jgi:DnaK suppressor protein